jgi:hypothetical protein
MATMGSIHVLDRVHLMSEDTMTGPDADEQYNLVTPPLMNLVVEYQGKIQYTAAIVPGEPFFVVGSSYRYTVYLGTHESEDTMNGPDADEQFNLVSVDERTRPFGIRMQFQMHDWLRTRAFNRRVSMASIIKEALDEYRKNHE